MTYSIIPLSLTENKMIDLEEIHQKIRQATDSLGDDIISVINFYIKDREYDGREKIAIVLGGITKVMCNILYQSSPTPMELYEFFCDNLQKKLKEFLEVNKETINGRA